MRRVGHTGIQGTAISIVLYGALLVWVYLSPPVRRPPEPRTTTRVRLVEARPAEPEPPPPPPPPPQPAPRRVEPARRAPAPTPVAPAPLLPAQPSPAPPPKAAAPRRFAVTLEGTVPGGGVAVPTAPPGGSPALRATPGGTGTGPDAPAYVVEPDSAPSLISQPGPSEMRALYPEAARRSGLEGDVRLELEVSATGEVTGSRVVRSAGPAFDEVAQQLVRRFRFRPATRNGKPVPAVVPWTYKFRLEG